MEELLNSLKTKYNYSDELIAFLGNLIPVMINYYGEEYKEIIEAAFLRNPIIFTDKTLAAEAGVPDRENELFQAAGGFVQETKVENNEVVYISKVIKNSNGFKKFDFNDIHAVGVLVHELCHMVKSGFYYNKESNQIFYRTGLDIVHEEVVDGDIKKISEIGTGLEEALNAIDEASIMTMMYGKYELTSNYKRLVYFINQMISGNKEFKDAIKRSQFLGTLDWEDYLGVELSQELLNLCDKHYDFMVCNIMKLIFDEKMQQQVFDIENRILQIVEISKEKQNNMI